ncbi:NitT/TauT family transport system ATP-binding protein [Variovorax boronicumulans]|uniref:ABC transporter ATP-binding protein n=1 Tax=Variovorax boronicumulans TaxID=436515 RepID=UPI00159E7295|nr:ATP-binding cassette domain-containing protein [Variovorax boronicumulans]MDQ0015342.1 NitT/TauT family transport system ATP-binding protein [Variovorax boronicumulans]
MSGQGVAIGLEGVSKRFGAGRDEGLQALGTVDLALRPGEFVSIVGPSGCGKSTLLRIMAGLVAPSTGRCTRPDGIATAFVFQEAALLPWRTVERNAQLLMELEGHAPADYRARAAEALALVGLAGFEKSYPHQLSGGMRMRLSLARALALRPGLLLLDEPLAAVDELTRDVLQEELSSLWRQAGFTGVLVTHNVHEAVYLSNRVVVMSPRPGRVLDVIEVPFEFPRQPELRASAGFAALTGQVTAVLRGQHRAEASA